MNTSRSSRLDNPGTLSRHSGESRNPENMNTLDTGFRRHDEEKRGSGTNMMQAVTKSKSNGWIDVGTLADIPKQGARVVRHPDGDIAVFRTANDEVFALRDRCPHKGGPLSQGIVYGNKVACPLHDWKINLDTGLAVAPDEGCAARFPVKLEEGRVLLSLVPDEGCPNK